jgi:hypothetical protein
MSAYRPMKVLSTGSITFVDQTMCISGWILDAGGRPGAPGDYPAEIAAAIGRFILDVAACHGATDLNPASQPVDSGTLVIAERETQRLLERARARPATRPSRRRDWPLVLWTVAWAVGVGWVAFRGVNW